MMMQNTKSVRRLGRALFAMLMGILCVLALSMAAPEPARVHAAGGAVYLNGAGGDDASDGTTAGSAVKTFARAKELAAADQSIQTIYITGTVSISGELSLKGTNAAIKRDPGFDGYLMRVNSNIAATLSDITLDGNSQAATKTTKSLVDVAGTLNVRDGAVLQNNALTDLDYFHAMGGAIHSDRGTINMTGGTIQNNTANYGGGIFLNYAVFNMSGGTIQGNKAVDGTAEGMRGMAAGGGVAVYQGSTFNLSGGAIQNNTSDNLGGGISIGTGVAGNAAYVLNMTGGTVAGNTAGSSGGGILVQAGYTKTYGTANISGGKITGNTMNGKGTGNSAFGGGGIYVNGYSKKYLNKGFHNGVLNLTNGVIKENKASMEGGGYASCPNSETHIYVKNGVALYGNQAKSAKEIYILASNAYGAHSGDPEYSIAPSMLGGTPYNWKYENGSEVPLNKLTGRLMAIHQESLSLHTDVTVDTGAENLAKVAISGNTSATRGAGIGSNGTVNMGQCEETSVTVAKRWDDRNSDGRPDTIQVELWRSQGGGKPVYVGYETVKAGDNWRLTFAHLPKNDADGHAYAYSVKERAVKGYATEAITGSQENGYTLTNVPSTRVKVTKVWRDNRGGKRPASVMVQLYADGKASGDPVKLTAAGGWTHTWSGLAKKQNGKTVVYTVDETTVPARYSKVITGNAAKGYVITNTAKTKFGPQPPAGQKRPRTGDPANVAALAASLGISAAMMAVLGIREKRRHATDR
ncbi:Cna B-type domain-containing protein [Pseudoramibacter sp. HA2172]|uniref:Cna B-type domain-containing protein n=1 Tax=Pseudoramibacter faecis TaxID=3108534 RepID=UPI002E791AE0|nr:Cna B-type domain-containing protein [Pseudoramibacter sp. HA2172]